MEIYKILPYQAIHQWIKWQSVGLSVHSSLFLSPCIPHPFLCASLIHPSSIPLSTLHPFLCPPFIHSSVHPSSIPPSIPHPLLRPSLIHPSVHPSSTPLPAAQSFPIPPSISFVQSLSTLSSPLHLSLSPSLCPSVNSSIHSPPILSSVPPLSRYLPVREMSETLHRKTLTTLHDQTVPLLTCISFCFAADTCIATSLRKSTYRSLKVNQGEKLLLLALKKGCLLVCCLFWIDTYAMNPSISSGLKQHSLCL